MLQVIGFEVAVVRLVESDIEACDALKWNGPKMVATSRGVRELRVAKPNEQFWEQWRTQKEALKSQGISVGKDKHGEWEVCWWRDVCDAKSISASRAVDNGEIEIPLPRGVSLRPYQRAGVAYAISRKRALIADEMGLGKTAQSIAACNVWQPKRVLVVCPTSLRENWRREWAQFSTLRHPVTSLKRQQRRMCAPKEA